MAFPKLEHQSRTVVLCFDPAPRNHGFAIFKIAPEKKRIDLLKVGKLRYTITSPKDNLQEQVAAFSKEVRDLIKRYEPQFICIERFLSRGRGAAGTAEAANLQIGAILEIARQKKIEVFPVLAVTWKARAKKILVPWTTGRGKKPHTGLDSWYTLNKKVPHPIDAFLIGCYFVDAYALLNRDVASVREIKRRLTKVT